MADKGIIHQIGFQIVKPLAGKYLIKERMSTISEIRNIFPEMGTAAFFHLHTTDLGVPKIGRLQKLEN